MKRATTRIYHGESAAAAKGLAELLARVELVHGPECRAVVERHIFDPRTLPCDVSQSHKNEADRALISKRARARRAKSRGVA